MYATVAIQELLNQENFELDDLLDEEGLQAEIRAGNQKLIQL